MPLVAGGLRSPPKVATVRPHFPALPRDRRGELATLLLFCCECRRANLLDRSTGGDGLSSDQNTLFIAGRGWTLGTCRVGPTEFANSSRAAAQADISSLETALTSAEQRRATLQAELAALEQAQPMGVVQLTPAALQHHLQGIIEKLRSEVAGRVREAIEQSVAQIVLAADGTMTLVAKPNGLLVVEERFAPLGCRGNGPIIV
jgi:hypothetical protein